MTGPLRPCGVCRQPYPDGDCPRHPRKGGYRPDRPSIINRAYGSQWRSLVGLVLRLAGWKCAYCAGPARTGDHVVPTSRGGRSDPDNVVAACRTCNTSKGPRTLREWIESGRAPAGAAKLLAERVANELPV